jgi:MFS family permease
MSTPAESKDLLELHHAERQRHFWRNYPAHAVEGGIFIGGMEFVHQTTILPRMIESLGGPQWVIAFTPVAMLLGMTSVQIFVARWIESMHRMKPLILKTGVFQRLPYLVAGLTLVFFAKETPAFAVAVMILAPLISGIIGGLSLPAWQEFIAKTIPENRLASLWAMRYLISAFIAFGAGKVVQQVLRQYPGATGFGLLHIITFCFLAVSYVVFSFTREVHLPPKRGLENRGDWREFVRGIPGMLREDRRLFLFLLGRFFWMGIHIVMPFVAIHALRKLELPDTFLGVFLIAQTAGSVSGNLLGGWIGDRFGGKAVVVFSHGAFLLFCALAPFVDTLAGFYLLFFLLGFSFIGGQIGMATLGFEISPLQKRVSYLTIQSVFMMPGMLLASVCASVLRGITTNLTILIVPAAVLVLISVVCVLQVREPRGKRAAA